MRVCCSATIIGTENVGKLNSNAIIATNHVTEIDPLLIIASLPFSSKLLPLIFVAREKQYYKTRWHGIRRLLYGGSLFRFIGGYEAYGGLNDYEQALKNHLRIIEKGMSVCVFPVGKLHNASEYKDAKGGVGYLAAKTGLPVLPIHIHGIHRKTTFWDCLLRRPKVTITIGEPLYADDMFAQSITSITANSQQECQAAAAVLMERVMSLDRSDVAA